MTCTLCGLDSGLQEFCCAGCANVYAILLESGLLAAGQNLRDTELFQRSLALGLVSNPAPDAEQGSGPPAETREAVFQLSGMWCASCAWLIEHALTRIHGVVSAEVHFASDLLKVRYCPQYLPPNRIVERVASLGYRAAEYTGRGTVSDAERNDLLLRVGVAAFLWMNVMTFSLVVYASYFERVTSSFGRFIPFILMGLATPAVFYCAAPVLRIAWTGVRERVLRMESLLALGILTAYGYSVAIAFTGGNHVYFDTVCAIVTLVLAGKTIERAAKEKTSRAVTLLYRLMPNKARIMVEGRERFVALEALEPGAVFRVKSGERIPADGAVVEGRSHVDESVLTGESVPRPKAPGDAVVCGSLNSGGVLDIRTGRVGADSTLARIVRTVEQAARNRTRVERSVDRASRLFIPGVLAISILTFAGWLARTGRPAEALLHAIAVLVIACPCALGIATPLALTTAVAAAARRGILVSDMRVLETIRAVDVVVLDKTGTATTGQFQLLEAVGDTNRMAELAAIEACSEHPIGKALAARAGGLTARDVRVHTGQGISGVVGETRYFLGNCRLVEAYAGQAVSPANPILPELEGTVVYFGWDGAVRGALSFGDPIRPEAAGLCAALHARGIRTILLSGDARSATARAAAGIGAVEWIAEATPEQKIEHIRSLQAAGARVAMIGDGVNDAPSLAQADLGIALGSGTDIAVQAAPLVLMGNGLGAVVETLDLSRRAFRVVRQNLFWAFGYNAAGITLAVAGVLNPILAAAAMVLSSVSVIANSRRLA
jgi:P-type Cu2+ transporter